MTKGNISQKQLICNDTSPKAVSSLWMIWWNVIILLQPAFSYFPTFMWFALAVAGITVRTETLGGVTSIVRALHLGDSAYRSLLKNFHSNAVRLDELSALWTRIVLQLLPNPVRVNGRLVLVGDGTKATKFGKKMPAVKRLHQHSEHKPDYIMGHSLQAVCLLVHAAQRIIAIPLGIRIHEGIILSNFFKETLLDKMLSLLGILHQGESYLFVGDRFYAVKKFALGLLERGNHLLVRVKVNAVACALPGPTKKKKRGRPPKYGKDIALASLFASKKMIQAASPVYGEQGITLRYVVTDLLWKPMKQLVRFVVVIHPTRGRWILMTTDTTMEAIEIIRTYGLRFKIGVSRLTTPHSVGESPTEARDLRLVAREAPWSESETVKPSDSMLGKEYMRHTRLQRTVNVDVASSNDPVAETVDCARRQQESFETSLRRRFSPAGYQRRHGVKGVVETGEARDARRRNLAEEARTITASGKCVRRRPGGGSGRSTDDGRAAKRARREGPGPSSDLSINVRHG